MAEVLLERNSRVQATELRRRLPRLMKLVRSPLPVHQLLGRAPTLTVHAHGIDKQVAHLQFPLRAIVLRAQRWSAPDVAAMAALLVHGSTNANMLVVDDCKFSSLSMRGFGQLLTNSTSLTALSLRGCRGLGRKAITRLARLMNRSHSSVNVRWLWVGDFAVPLQLLLRGARGARGAHTEDPPRLQHRCTVLPSLTQRDSREGTAQRQIGATARPRVRQANATDALRCGVCLSPGRGHKALCFLPADCLMTLHPPVTGAEGGEGAGRTLVSMNLAARKHSFTVFTRVSIARGGGFNRHERVSQLALPLCDAAAMVDMASCGHVGVACLDLSGQPLGPSMAGHVLKLIRAPHTAASLTCLDLTGTQLGNKGCEDIARALFGAPSKSPAMAPTFSPTCPGLISLSLAGCGMGDGPAVLIADALRANAHVVCLNLGRNPLADPAVEALADCLTKHNRTLTRLSLACVRATVASMKAVAACLARGGDGMPPGAAASGAGSSLVHVDLRGNTAATAGVDWASYLCSDACLESSTLSTLLLHRWSIPVDQLHASFVPQYVPPAGMPTVDLPSGVRDVDVAREDDRRAGMDPFEYVVCPAEVGIGMPLLGTLDHLTPGHVPWLCAIVVIVLNQICA